MKRYYFLKIDARKLRRKGETHREISNKLKVSLSTIHLWTRDIFLSKNQKVSIEKRRRKPYYSQEKKQALRQKIKERKPYLFKKYYSPEELIQKITAFYKFHKRIPLKHEFNMYGEYKKRFGSWNNAIQAAGFIPNKVIFSKIFFAQDGHVCHSLAEKIIDDWLFRKNIPHQRHSRYPDSKMTVDFVVNNMYIEYFGLKGSSRKYSQIIRKKRRICKKAKIQLIEIYPHQLFSKDSQVVLSSIFNPLFEIGVAT